MLIITALFFSCATAERRPGQPDIKRVIAAVNRGDAELLSEMSAVPFLLDGEIISLDTDISRFWLSLAEAGFTFGKSGIAAVYEAGADTFKIFADSMEVKVFFAKYAAEFSVIAEIGTGAGTMLLLLSPAKGGKTLIRGMKGPLS